MTDLTPDELAERRRHERCPMIKPCKVRDRRGLLFSPGHTTNLSISGALINIDRARPFAKGDELDLVIAPPSGTVVASSSMVRAVVRRITPIDFHHQAVAVEFEHPQSMLAAA